MPNASPTSTEPSRMLVTGASGQLGSYLLRLLAASGRDVVAWSGGTAGERSGYRLTPVDLASPREVQQAFVAAAPRLVLHAAALSRVDLCCADPRRADAINADATRQLVELSRAAGARLVYVSTDLVFDGQQGDYTEDAVPRPLSHYGRSKRAGEIAVLQSANTIVVRISLLVGPSLSGKPTFFDQQRTTLLSGQNCTLFTDEWRTPLGYEDAARSLLAIADSETTGCLHVGGPERVSRYEMGAQLADMLGVPRQQLVAASRLAASAIEPRPADVSLNSALFRRLFPREMIRPWHTVLAADRTKTS